MREVIREKLGFPKRKVLSKKRTGQPSFEDTISVDTDSDDGEEDVQDHAGSYATKRKESSKVSVHTGSIVPQAPSSDDALQKLLKSQEEIIRQLQVQLVSPTTRLRGAKAGRHET